MLVRSHELYKKAREGGYAIGAFNTSLLEETKAIINTAARLNSPVIIETSEGEMDYLSPKISAAEVRVLAEEVTIPVVLHLDHGRHPDEIKQAIDSGYTSIHVDGSALIYDENVELTKQIVKIAHAANLLVEGEIGHIVGASEAHAEVIKISPDTLTDPAEAKEFVAATGVDVLAVAIGNIHGVYKDPPVLDFERFREITERVGTYFSLHGGSGIPEDQIRKAIGMGISKINVNTELRVAFHDGLAHEFAEHPQNVVPYKYFPAGIEAVEHVVESKIMMFGSAGKA
jgi:ketose-bisphosphate aldolase